MTTQHGPPQLPPPDRSKSEATADFAAEVRALNHLHAIEEWTIDVTTGALMGMCACTHDVYTTVGEHHWARAVRHVRGLDRLPKPK